jgi:ISXO2 transposase-like protein
LGLGSYRTAWNLLHELRRAMVRPGRERLQGIIEVDEIFIGGPRPGKRGRGAQGKVLVVIAAQQAAKGIGRIRLTRVADASARSQRSPPPSRSAARTDDWRGYGGLDRLGYRRQIVRSSAEVGENLLPLANRVASLLKRWLLGTHQGGGQCYAPRLLLGRVHLPLLSPQIMIARPAAPAADAASRRSCPHPCQGNPRRTAAHGKSINLT